MGGFVRQQNNQKMDNSYVLEMQEIVNGGFGEVRFHMTTKYSGNVLSHVLTLERREQSVWLSWE